MWATGVSTDCVYLVGQKSDARCKYVSIMPYEQQNKTYLYCLNILNIFYQFLTIYILHAECASNDQTAFVVGASNHY